MQRADVSESGWPTCCRPRTPNLILLGLGHQSSAHCTRMGSALEERKTLVGVRGVGADWVAADKPRRAAPALRRDDAPGLVGVEGRLARRPDSERVERREAN